MKIVWDEPKRQAVLRERNLDFADVTPEFLAVARVTASRGRLKAVGMLRGKPMAVIYALLGSEAVSIVTMRPASRKERSQL